MQSKLLERLSKEKPAHNKDEIEEALRRGYSLEQILLAMKPELIKTEPRLGNLKYSGQRGQLEIPYTYENYRLLCRILFE